MAKSETKIFQEALDGYGFEEVSQTSEGVYCQGCMTVHKRPTKMYDSKYVRITPVCRFQIVQLYNPEENCNG